LSKAYQPEFEAQDKRKGTIDSAQSALICDIRLKERSMPKNTLVIMCILAVVILLHPAVGYGQDAQTLIKAAVEYYRGKASVATVEMTIHRPNWERKMTMKAWTKGQKNSLFTIIAPSKDRGNGTLKRGREMWTYNPKVNRVIKLPPSMMSQSWMGSDFSNNDLAKSDSILEDYTHKIVGTETHQGKTVYVVESVPKPAAPVVWGMQRLKVREDFILLSEEFFDEDLLPVKEMSGSQIEMLSGKLFPRIWTMKKSDTRDEYTRLNYRELVFKETLPNSLFSLSSLKSNRR
jgi:outer membrane lipoprotein-sorting protein